MPSVQIKNVPEETHVILRRRAAASHQSLQEYLLRSLIEAASRPTMGEIVDEIEQDAGLVSLTADEITDSLRRAREGC